MRPPTPIGTHGEINTRKLPTGKWVARTRYRDKHGKLKDITARANTKAAAKTRLQQKLEVQQPTGYTLYSYTKKWFETYKETVGQSTVRITSLVIENNLKPHGDAPLHTLTVPMLDAMIQAAAVQNKVTDHKGRAYLKGGTSTAKRLRVILNLVLNEAVREGLLEHNPAAKTRPVDYTPPAPKALTPQDVQQLLKLIEYKTSGGGRKKNTAYWLPDLSYFLAGTGCRLGEALAMRWDRIDFTTGQCTINATLIVRGNKPLVQERTKTGVERIITLPSWVISRLLERRVNALGEFVFTKIDGDLLNPSTASEKFKELAEPEYPGATPKLLRSTVATLVEREQGIQAAGLQLGHEGTATTRKSYVERNGVAPVSAVLEGLTIYSPETHHFGK